MPRGPGPEPDRSYRGRSVDDRRAERRARFREAGLELFGTVGFAGTTISALCAEAGLSRRQFYEEYSSSEDLLTEVYDWIQTSARERVTSALATVQHRDLRTRATIAVDAYFDEIAADPRCVRCSFIEVSGVSETVAQHLVAGRARWSDYIAARIGAVSPSRPSPDTDYRATALIGALTAAAHRWAIADPRPDRAVIVEMLADLLVHVAET